MTLGDITVEFVNPNNEATFAGLVALLYLAAVAVLVSWRILNAFLKLTHRDDALHQSLDAFYRFTRYLRF